MTGGGASGAPAGAPAGGDDAGRSTVYLLAPAGHPNYGDELILRLWLRSLHRLWPHARVVVDCHTPGQAAVLHRDTHPDLTVTDTVWRLVAEAGGDRPATAERAVEFVRRALRDRGTRPGLSDGIDLLLSADVVHVVGGGFVNTRWPHHLGVLAAAGSCAELSGARVVATGQGLCPAPASPVLADALRGFSLVTVRDRASLTVLEDAGVTDAGTEVRLVGDDAWLAGSPLTAPEPPDLRPHYCTDPELARDVVVCLQSDFGEVEALVEVAGRILRRWRVTGDRITVIEGIPGADRVVWDRLVAADGGAGPSAGWDRARFVPFTELWARGLPARPGQRWLTTRFHPHLMAAAAGAGGVAVAIGPDYYGVKHDSLVAAGSPWPVVASAPPPGDQGGSAAPVEPAVPEPSASGLPDTVSAARVPAAEELARRIYP